MPRFALRIELDGAGFNGTQAQRAGLRTVQGALADALARLCPGQPAVRLSSRLDAGVSAQALVADAVIDRVRDLPPQQLALALSSHLPADLAVTAVAIVDDGFDSRIAASKTYRYRLRVRGVRPVLDRRCWWLRRLDRSDLLAELAPLLIGRRDLSGFACLRHDRSDGDDPVREIFAADWTADADGLGPCWTFRITGSGFLYRQVRGIVGAMVAVGQGLASVAEFTAAAASGRGAGHLGNLAPAEGLCLERVDYHPALAWIEA